MPSAKLLLFGCDADHCLLGADTGQHGGTAAPPTAASVAAVPVPQQAAQAVAATADPPLPLNRTVSEIVAAVRKPPRQHCSGI